MLGLARLGHVQAAAGLLIGLARAGALARQVAVALDFALGEAQVGGVGPRDRQRLADHRLMAFQRGVGVDELGRGHGQVGAAAARAATYSRSSMRASSWPAATLWLSSASTSWMKPDTWGATTVWSATTAASSVDSVGDVPDQAQPV